MSDDFYDDIFLLNQSFDAQHVSYEWNAWRLEVLNKLPNRLTGNCRSNVKDQKLRKRINKNQSEKQSRISVFNEILEILPVAEFEALY